MNGLGPRTTAKTSQRTAFERLEVTAKLPCAATMRLPYMGCCQAGCRHFATVWTHPLVRAVHGSSSDGDRPKSWWGEEKEKKQDGRKSRKKRKRIEIKGVGHVSCPDLRLFLNFQKLYFNLNFPLNSILAPKSQNVSYFGTFRNSILMPNLRKNSQVNPCENYHVTFQKYGILILPSLIKFHPWNFDYGTSTN